MLERRTGEAERSIVQTREWILTALVIVVPLVIAVVVTLWSLEQARYRPKKRRLGAHVPRETDKSVERPAANPDAA
jgi:hypothetical protein